MNRRSLYDQAIALFKEKFEDYVLPKEDSNLMVINKPAWIPSHSDRHYSEGIIEVAKAARGNDSFILPHRLDIETTGNIIILKNPSLRATFANANWKNMTQKRYLAVVEGKYQTRGPKEVCLFLDTNGEKVKVKKGGKFSITIFETLKVYDEGYTLVEAQIMSGRKHQIRVSLAHLGYPVLGDSLYSDNKNEENLYLHSYNLKIRKALGTNEWYDFYSPVPEHFKEFVG